jgi:hypothetical protein
MHYSFDFLLGLDGKFRVFSTQTQHQPEVQSSTQLHSQQNHQHLQQEPVKFPITNGSLFTSVDGRLPIIHNYRRGKGGPFIHSFYSFMLQFLAKQYLTVSYQILQLAS